MQPPSSKQPFIQKKSEKHIDVKGRNKKEMEGIHDNASAFMDLNRKTNK